MNKTLGPKLLALLFNIMPFYRRTGGRVIYISKDENEVHIKLPFTWTTRNFVGTIYGGHIYSAVDGVYFTLFFRKLGKQYQMWDKSSSIRYIKPARTSLLAKVTIPAGEVESIHNELSHNSSIERSYIIQWQDTKGETVAVIEKTLYFGRKNAHKR